MRKTQGCSNKGPLRVRNGAVVGCATAVALAALLLEPVARTHSHERDAGNGVAALGVAITPEAEPVTWDIPIHRTPAVERWIDVYTRHGREYFGTWLDRMTRYEGLIRGELRRRGMPEDLVYVALIESGFHPLALSSARASGLWQFMEGTAREQGLVVNEYVDERLDPIRSTEAAIDFLHALHEEFGSWYLATAAYNAGPTRVRKVLDRHAPERPGSEELFWEISRHLPAETQEHIPRLVAAAILGKEPERFGFQPDTLSPMSYDFVFTPGGTTLADVADAAGVSEHALREINPHLIRGVSPPGLLYPVRVPGETASRVLAGLSSPSAPPSTFLAE